MECAQMSAPGVAAPGRRSSTASAWDTGPNGLGKTRVTNAPLASREIRRRSAWHYWGPPKEAPKRNSSDAVYARAPYYRSTWGPIPAPHGNARTSPYPLHGSVERQALLHVPSGTPWEGPLNDPKRQALYARVLEECHGDRARADVVLAFRLRRTPLTRAHIDAHNWQVVSALLAWAWPRGVKRPATPATPRPRVRQKIGTPGTWATFAPMALRQMRQAPLREAA